MGCAGVLSVILVVCMVVISYQHGDLISESIGNESKGLFKCISEVNSPGLTVVALGRSLEVSALESIYSQSRHCSSGS